MPEGTTGHHRDSMETTGKFREPQAPLGTTGSHRMPWQNITGPQRESQGSTRNHRAPQGNQLKPHEPLGTIGCNWYNWCCYYTQLMTDATVTLLVQNLPPTCPGSALPTHTPSSVQLMLLHAMGVRFDLFRSCFIFQHFQLRLEKQRKTPIIPTFRHSEMFSTLPHPPHLLSKQRQNTVYSNISHNGWKNNEKPR